MKIKFDTQELVNALTKASKAFPQNGTCRLEVKLAEGKYYLNVIAYNEVDLQVQAIAAVEVEEYKDAVLTVCGRKLLEKLFVSLMTINRHFVILREHGMPMVHPGAARIISISI